MLRDEVLRRLGARLPAEMRLLEAALAAPDAPSRLALLKKYALLSTDVVPQEAAAPSSGGGEEGGGEGGGGSGSEGGSLYCLAADLAASASRLISDMELLPKVPDRCAPAASRHCLCCPPAVRLLTVTRRPAEQLQCART